MEGHHDHLDSHPRLQHPRALDLYHLGAHEGARVQFSSGEMAQQVGNLGGEGREEEGRGEEGRGGEGRVGEGRGEERGGEKAVIGAVIN